MSIKPYIIFFIIVIIVIVLYNYYSYVPSFRCNNKVPKIIHLIYIPWDKNQKLKDNYLDFDKKSYEELRDKNPEYFVKLWNLLDIKEFLSIYYPQYYDFIFQLYRPVMIVDLIRLLIVYHYGGIYWQYGSKRKVKSMDYFLPTENKKVKLFTEIIITQKYSKYMADSEIIRNGEPEELIRVCTQIFSAEKNHPYMLILFLKGLSNCKKYKPQRDYDILYISGNAMMSKVYNEVGRYMNDIELVDYKTVRKMLNISSNGSWRIDKNKGSIISMLKNQFIKYFDV